MRKLATLLLAITALAPLAGVSAQSADRTADEAAIRAVIQAFLDTRERNDAAALGAVDAGAAVGAPPLEQAETMSSSAAPAARRDVRDMSISSCVRIRGLPLPTCARYDRGVPAVS